MALGYAKWFQQAWQRARKSADACQSCPHSLCQPADHYMVLLGPA